MKILKSIWNYIKYILVLIFAMDVINILILDQPVNDRLILMTVAGAGYFMYQLFSKKSEYNKESDNVNY